MLGVRVYVLVLGFRFEFKDAGLGLTTGVKLVCFSLARRCFFFLACLGGCCCSVLRRRRSNPEEPVLHRVPKWTWAHDQGILVRLYYCVDAHIACWDSVTECFEQP
jgi:hypothetical protein